MQAELPRSELSGQGEIEVNGNPVSREKSMMQYHRVWYRAL